MYARVVKLMKNRKEFDESQLELLEEIVMDAAKAQAIVDASKMSMGVFYMYNTFLLLIGKKRTDNILRQAHELNTIRIYSLNRYGCIST